MKKLIFIVCCLLLLSTINFAQQIFDELNIFDIHHVMLPEINNFEQTSIQWSADGKLLAFYSHNDSEREVSQLIIEYAVTEKDDQLSFIEITRYGPNELYPTNWQPCGTSCVNLSFRPEQFWSDDRTMVAIQSDNKLKIYGVNDDDGILTSGDIIFEKLPNYAFAFSSSGRYILYRSSVDTVVFDLESGRQIMTLNNVSGDVFAWHPTSDIIAIPDTDATQVSIFDVTAGQIQTRLTPPLDENGISVPGMLGGFSDLSWRADGEYLMGQSLMLAKPFFWDSESGELIDMKPDTNATIWKWHPIHTWLTSMDVWTLQVFDTNINERLFAYVSLVDTETVDSAANIRLVNISWSPNGRYLLVEAAQPVGEDIMRPAFYVFEVTDDALPAGGTTP